MDLATSMVVAASGMRAQSTRMRIIAENIANANSTSAVAGVDPYRRKIATMKTEFDRELDANMVTAGKPLNDLDRQMIADSAAPKSIRADLMAGLHKDLTDAQIEAIFDKYTIGKVAFTMNGYRAIVPDLTPKEEETILGFLKQARDEAIDYKNVREVSAIFEIYKTKSEQFLNSNGRDWKKLYKAYSDAAKAKKAAAPPAGTQKP